MDRRIFIIKLVCTTPGGQFSKAADRFTVHLYVWYRWPQFRLAIGFDVLDALKVEQFLGFDTPGAVGQGVDDCCHSNA